MRRLTPPPNHRKARAGERGQTLVLFVAVFTVLLGISAFAVDQGMWLAKRRVAQKDADTAARGGAYLLLVDPAAAGATEAEARRVADQNGVPVNANTIFTFSDTCETRYFGTTDAPSVHAQINEPTGSLFSRVLGIDGIQDLGANATACVGEPTEGEGHDPFYTGPGVSSPTNRCFNGDEPQLGIICPVMVPATFHTAGNRQLLSLQDDPRANNVDPFCDPFASNGCQTECTQPSSNNLSEQIVESSNAICRLDDGVYTKGGTLNTEKGSIRCRIRGYAIAGNSNCPLASRSVEEAPGEGACDDEFHVSGTQIPPFPDTITGFDPVDAIPSPSGVDDFVEAFSRPDGEPLTSLTGTEFLVPNICAGRTSPRIFTIILVEGPPDVQVVRIKAFATFFVLGCQELEGPTSDALVGPIDPFCENIRAATTALVGIFVKAFAPSSGGIPEEPCDPEAVGTQCSIVLVK